MVGTEHCKTQSRRMLLFKTASSEGQGTVILCGTQIRQIVHTYREACLAKGRFEDDSALQHDLEEAATMS